MFCSGVTAILSAFVLMVNVVFLPALPHPALLRSLQKCSGLGRQPQRTQVLVPPPPPATPGSKQGVCWGCGDCSGRAPPGSEQGVLVQGGSSRVQNRGSWAAAVGIPAFGNQAAGVCWCALPAHSAQRMNSDISTFYCPPHRLPWSRGLLLLPTPAAVVTRPFIASHTACRGQQAFYCCPHRLPWSSGLLLPPTPPAVVIRPFIAPHTRCRGQQAFYCYPHRLTSSMVRPGGQQACRRAMRPPWARRAA